MNYFFSFLLIFSLFSCAPKETPQIDSVDLDELSQRTEPPQSTVDIALLANTQTPEASENNLEEEERTAPAKVILTTETMPVSKPHSGSPGGVIADTLQVFQCEKNNAESQNSFFLHVLNYRIHKLGAHPLCEVIQVTDIKKVLAHANYQREFCDTYTSNFINQQEQHQCVSIITLRPSEEPPV